MATIFSAGIKLALSGTLLLNGCNALVQKPINLTDQVPSEIPVECFPLAGKTEGGFNSYSAKSMETCNTTIIQNYVSDGAPTLNATAGPSDKRTTLIFINGGCYELDDKKGESFVGELVIDELNLNWKFRETLTCRER
jgi:hypothetical protein